MCFASSSRFPAIGPTLSNDLRGAHDSFGDAGSRRAQSPALRHGMWWGCALSVLSPSGTSSCSLRCSLMTRRTNHVLQLSCTLIWRKVKPRSWSSMASFSFSCMRARDWEPGSRGILPPAYLSPRRLPILQMATNRNRRRSTFEHVSSGLFPHPLRGFSMTPCNRLGSDRSHGSYPR